MTIAKANTPEEIPVFVRKFEKVIDSGDFVRNLKAQGYTHYLNLKMPKSVTVGGLDHEFRVMIGAAFFKGVPPSFDELRAGIAGIIPVYEYRKYYAYMSGIGRGDFEATLTGTELKEWIAFFEPEPGTVLEIDEFFK